MNASLRVRSRRGAALVLALGLTVALTTLGRGVVAAVADPPTEATTTATTTRDPLTTTNSAVTSTPASSVVTTTTASSALTTTTTEATSSSTALTTTTSPTSSLGATDTSTSATLKSSGTTVSSVAVSSTSSRAIPTAVPKTLQADPQNIQVAQASTLTRQDPGRPAEDGLRLLTLAKSRSNPDVLQFDQRLITYDNFLRTSIVNPFARTLHIFWQIAGGVVQEIVIPAFGRIVTSISEPGPHSVVGILPSDTGEPGQVTAAVIDGGGHDPGPDEPPPPAPPAPTERPDTCVAAHYGGAQYNPFIVRKIVDVGYDPQYGEHKVLLDGVTPVWGTWTQSDKCGTQFEVHKTQALPGVDEPRQVPIPGYPMELASETSSTSFDLFAVLVALIVAALILGAILVAVKRAWPKTAARSSRTRWPTLPRPCPPNSCRSPARRSAGNHRARDTRRRRGYAHHTTGDAS
jgi:hypothetical protein